ncbi:MAG TPA: BlaI/MecI/CopY family transcriptional regulator [Thermoanaerobaculia bacterium]|nr:BlaI/MecI/CopY family transcriptional regulator [Thermoanaerobaculia bacterium]
MSPRPTSRSSPRPTDAELEILTVLWNRGASTVREVQEDLGRPAGYTTVLKLLQIMLEKGLVTRDESERSHRYEAARTREQTQGRLVADLIGRAFDGSASELVLRALDAKPVPREELEQIQRVLDRLEEEKP